MHLMRSSNHELEEEWASIVVCDTDMKTCMMDDDEIDETKVDEKKTKVGDDKKKVKVEESSPVTLCPNNKRKLDDSIQEVKDGESDDEEKSDDSEKSSSASSSTVSCESKKRKLEDSDLRHLNDSDLDKLLFDAAVRVQKGLDCVAVAQTNMQEAKDVLRKIQAVVDKISKERRAPLSPPNVD